ncbi:hypothetical protein HJC23_001769 [Cyclotella cryptica]|uniref:Uncharacterized protein n=1 Tax=Cyclotella cryptica TaxID=29204 RepID=A0ABD3QPE0_9STRA|eukprot:CCRYP_003335-RA/>CCRYP_003335-RA protein AED:0.04 eAED:0.04 QI:281/1/1/1/1/1/4/542/705
MRRRGGPSTSHHRPAYSSAIDPPSRLTTLSAKLPTLVLLVSFLVGWLLGDNDTSRNVIVRIGRDSIHRLRSMGHDFLLVTGFMGRRECVSADGGSDNIAYCSISQLLGKLTRERVVLESRMQSMAEYGMYYHGIFNDVTTKPTNSFPAMVEEDHLPRTASRYSGPESKQAPLFYASYLGKRLKRRILMKHLQAVVLRGKGMPSQNERMEPTFTWITAGDGTAAGHGNLYLQSYTAILQDTVESSFRALGIRFEAKNYAMGQYSSGPELSLCIKEVFGDDIDALMWDFATLQPQLEPVHRTLLWGHRATLHPTLPIMFSFDTFGRRFNALKEFGVMDPILMHSDWMQVLREKMPDSALVDPSELPEGLRYYVCNGSVEGGVRCNNSLRNFVCYVDNDEMEDREFNSAVVSPNVCRDHKFLTRPQCVDARFQVSWNPGWKDHLLKGRLLGIFLVNMLNEAILELDDIHSIVGTDPMDVLDFLERQEGEDVATFLQKPFVSDFWGDSAIKGETILRAETTCHTALFPSKSRLEGISTLSDKVGDVHGGFDKGENQALMYTPTDGKLPLAYDMNDRQQCEFLEVDHKDFFLVREQDGWVHTVVPNDREIEVYKRMTPVQGIIVICLKICPLNKCPDAYISIDEISRRSKLFITVDREPVTNVVKLDGCNVLVGENGNTRWGAKDQFELRFRINDPGTLRVLKISSIIVF